MSEKLTLVELDGITGTEKIRELNEQELEEHSQLILRNKKLLAEEEAKAEARANALTKLAALGLTEEEIAAL